MCNPTTRTRKQIECVFLHGRRTVAVSLCLIVVKATFANDWPQILGPDRNGRASNQRVSRTWSDGGPRMLWQRGVGQGFAGVAVAEGQVVLFHRRADEEVVEGLDPITGRQLWEARFESNYTSSISPDSGPRCVPVIHDGAVYLLGAAGQLSCVSLSNGQVRWSRDVRADFGAPEGYFGTGSTPLVEADKLLVNVGGRSGSGIVAFSLTTGQTVWKATNELASYSSPVAVTIDGVRHAIFVTRMSVVSVDPTNGSERFRFPFGMRGPTVKAANPVVIDNHVFLSASYGVGAALLKMHGGTAEVAWRKGDVMSSQYMTSFYHNGVLYGVDGRADGGTCRLRAFDPLTGKVYWTQEDYGMATIMAVGNTLVILKTDGDLVLADATLTRYRETARHKVFDTTARALPAIAVGKLYARDSRVLKCLDLSAAADD